MKGLLENVVTRNAANAVMGLALLALAGSAQAQVDPNSGTDFVVVAAAGNAPFRQTGSVVDGSGQVDYDFAIGRTEITSLQWVRFLNAVYDRPASDGLVEFRSRPEFFGGARITPINSSNPAALRWGIVAGRENMPVTGISWRAAAMYCNWVHNNRQTSLESFSTGAYDLANAYTSTARLPGARYFIPTHDEWLKAVHYDPTKQNADGSLGGWWRYGNRSDTGFIGGPPGAVVNGQEATANTGWMSGDYGLLEPQLVLLGSYPNVTSPWGLLDVAGSASEWTETMSGVAPNRGPRYDGSRYDTRSPFESELDTITGSGSQLNLDGVFLGRGFRLGMVVPAPSALCLGSVGLIWMSRRRR
jgi:formylglycine-generating enzyme required for sulfatase activity